MELVCSDKDFYFTEARLHRNNAIVTIESVHGCPVYQVPAMLEFLLDHNIFIAVVTMLFGLFFLFFGRTFFRIVAFLVIVSALTILGCWACFRLMEHDVATSYLYISIAAIIVLAGLVAYLTVRFMIRLTFFCLGARTPIFYSVGCFFVMGYFKAFILSFFDQNQNSLLTAAFVYLVITLILMAVVGVVLLKF